jgi:uracil-DNA glycosylase
MRRLTRRDSRAKSGDLLFTIPDDSPMTALPFVDYDRPALPPEGGRIALIGEAPGAEEARLGHPFVGRSGRLLDEGLAAVGIDRRRCLVANVFRYQPPGNKVGHFFASRARAKREGLDLDERWGAFGASDRLLAAFAGELDALAAALAEFAPAVIVALGRTPAWALTGQNGILDLRGRELPCRLYPGAPVIPTYHPSFILRGQFALIPTFHADLRAARERAG